MKPIWEWLKRQLGGKQLETIDESKRIINRWINAISDDDRLLFSEQKSLVDIKKQLSDFMKKEKFQNGLEAEFGGLQDHGTIKGKVFLQFSVTYINDHPNLINAFLVQSLWDAITAYDDNPGNLDNISCVRGIAERWVLWARVGIPNGDLVRPQILHDADYRAFYDFMTDPEQIQTDLLPGETKRVFLSRKKEEIKRTIFDKILRAYGPQHEDTLREIFAIPEINQLFDAADADFEGAFDEANAQQNVNPINEAQIREERVRFLDLIKRFRKENDFRDLKRQLPPVAEFLLRVRAQLTAMKAAWDADTGLEQGRYARILPQARLNEIDRLMLAFYRMPVSADEANELAIPFWHFTNFEATTRHGDYLIQGSAGVNNDCLLSSIFFRNPEIAITFGMSVDEIMDFIAPNGAIRHEEVFGPEADTVKPILTDMKHRLKRVLEQNNLLISDRELWNDVDESMSNGNAYDISQYLGVKIVIKGEGLNENDSDPYNIFICYTEAHFDKFYALMSPEDFAQQGQQHTIPVQAALLPAPVQNRANLAQQRRDIDTFKQELLARIKPWYRDTESLGKDTFGRDFFNRYQNNLRARSAAALPLEAKQAVESKGDYKNRNINTFADWQRRLEEISQERNRSNGGDLYAFFSSAAALFGEGYQFDRIPQLFQQLKTLDVATLDSAGLNQLAENLERAQRLLQPGQREPLPAPQREPQRIPAPPPAVPTPNHAHLNLQREAINNFKQTLLNRISSNIESLGQDTFGRDFFYRYQNQLQTRSNAALPDDAKQAVERKEDYKNRNINTFADWQNRLEEIAHEKSRNGYASLFVSIATLFGETYSFNKIPELLHRLRALDVTTLDPVRLNQLASNLEEAQRKLS